MYEDENDNYNYEKGICSTITFDWNDKKKTLTIDDRNGSFPGMLENRHFDILIVDGEDTLGEKIQKTVSYTGKRIDVKF